MGGFLSQRQTRCLMPLSTIYRYSHGILGIASPASLPGSTQEKLCGAKEAISIQLRRGQSIGLYYKHSVYINNIRNSKIKHNLSLKLLMSQVGFEPSLPGKCFYLFIYFIVSQPASKCLNRDTIFLRITCKLHIDTDKATATFTS